MTLSRYTRRTLARELVLLLVAAVFCVPLYLLIAVSLKSFSDAYAAPLSFPWHAHWGNYSQAWRTGGRGGLAHGLQSSLVITISSVVSLVAIGSFCAYVIARRASRLTDALYVAFVLGIILPFVLAIVPLYVAMRHLGLLGNYLGMIVLNVGLLMPLTVFLYTGFIRALPRDYEEAAWVDGAGTVRTFRRVVLPLLRPITGTVAVLAGTVIWNEFFIALVFLSGSRYETLPVALYSFVGEFTTQWNLVFCGVAIALAPVLAFYLFAQRHMIRGFASGLRG